MAQGVKRRLLKKGALPPFKIYHSLNKPFKETITPEVSAVYRFGLTVRYHILDLPISALKDCLQFIIQKQEFIYSFANKRISARLSPRTQRNMFRGKTYSNHAAPFLFKTFHTVRTSKRQLADER